MTRSLNARLLIALVGTVLIAAGASLAIGVVTTRHAVRDSIRDELSRQADAFARTSRLFPRIAPEARPGPALPPPGAERPPPPGPRGRPGIPLPPPEPDAGSPRLVSLAAAARLLPADAMQELRRSGSADGTADLGGERRLFAARRTRGGEVLVLSRSADIGSDTGSAVRGLLLASGLGVLLAAIVAGLLSRRLAAPVGRAAGAARELAAGRRPTPLPAEGTRELDELTAAVNDLAAQLATARDAERAVLLSVSHELRTPLTAIRGYAEGVSDGTVPADVAAPVIVAEAGRLERLVQDLLALARLEQGVLEVRRERVDLAEVAREAHRRLALEAERAGVELSVGGSGDSTAGADRDRVLQVISNLVENAIRVTPAGGRVAVTTGPGRIEVADTGPGIPAEELPRAFERFHLRGRERRAAADGSGIGLAIVRELTEAMGGRVSVSNDPGSGARFVISLPR